MHILPRDYLEKTLSEELAVRGEQKSLRRLRQLDSSSSTEVLVDGKHCISFASNDYLGLSQHPILKRRAIEYIEKYGAGSPSSRLIAGNHTYLEALEKKLADLKGKPASLIFSTGYQLNATVLSTMLKGDSAVLIDRLAHFSLLSGIMSRRCSWTRYAHDDTGAIRDLLTKPAMRQKKFRWIVTESVFSMDGNCINMPDYCRAARENEAHLYVDEAHATGVLGESGLGLTVGHDDVTVCMGTFGKGLGSFGAYIVCSQTIRDYLINFCPGIIYSTALSPGVIGAIDAALDLIPQMHDEREQLQMKASGLRDALRKLGFETGRSATHIIPVIVETAQRASCLSKHLEENGIFAPAIRPPAVEEGKARIRLSLSALHEKAHIDHLLSALRRWR
jgi:8-amino-7-oxononanoate synthase